MGFRKKLTIDPILNRKGAELIVFQHDDNFFDLRQQRVFASARVCV